MTHGEINRRRDSNRNEEERQSSNVDSEEVPLLKVKETQLGGSSTFGATFLIVNAALGAGLLNFPKAYDQAGGVLVAVLVQGSMLVFIMAALIILAKTSNLNQSSTLQEVMFTSAGPWGRGLTSLIITVYCFGTCITFLIIIGDQFDRAFASLVGPEFCRIWYLNRNFIMPASSLVFILPLCYSKNIDFLQYVSMAGVLTVIYVVGLILVEYSFGGHNPGPIKTCPDKWSDVFTVIPVICFGYQCHVSVIPIYSCMKQRNLKQFSIAASTAIAICVVVYTGAATLGYFTFGNDVKGDILSNYSATKPSVMIALIAMAAKTYTTYPILLFCGREGASSLIKDFFVSEDTIAKEKVRRYVLASIWFFLTMILAIEMPNIGEVINILGSLAAIFIFVFPGLCLLSISLGKDPLMASIQCKLGVGCSFLFLAFGAFLFGVVLTQAIIFNLSGASKDAPLCETTLGRGVQFYVNLFDKT